MLKTHLSIAVILLLIVACGRSKKTTEASSVEKSKGPDVQLLWKSDTILRTPESVIYDEERELVYVSNVNENPWGKDDNGYISRMDTNGKVVNPYWVEGLSGPKGMAIVGNSLFVADIDELVNIDIITGEVVEKMPLIGAVNLNDVTADSQGRVYISDSGNNAVYRYSEGVFQRILGDVKERPNGLRIIGNELLVAFSGSSNVVKYNLDDESFVTVTEGIGHGDGIMETNTPSNFIVSGWQGQVYHYSPKGGLTNLIDTKDEKINSADIWFIKSTNMLLVPTFFDNRVVAYRLKE